MARKKKEKEVEISPSVANLEFVSLEGLIFTPDGVMEQLSGVEYEFDPEDVIVINKE